MKCFTFSFQTQSFALLSSRPPKFDDRGKNSRKQGWFEVHFFQASAEAECAKEENGVLLPFHELGTEELAAVIALKPYVVSVRHHLHYETFARKFCTSTNLVQNF